MDSSSSEASNASNNDDINISSNGSKNQIQSLDATVKPLTPIENFSEKKTYCVSPGEDIELRWYDCDDNDEQSIEKNLADEMELLKDSDDETISKKESQHKLTVQDSKMLSDNSVALEDPDSDNLNSIEIVEPELLKDKPNLATIDDNSVSVNTAVIKKTLKDPNVMLEIPTYIDISNSDCQLNDTFNIMDYKNDDHLVKNKKTDNVNIIEEDQSKSSFASHILKSLKNEETIVDIEADKMKKILSNIEDDLLKSPENEENLLDDEPILIDSEDPEPEIINIIEDDDILEPTPNISNTMSVLSHNDDLQDTLKRFTTDLNDPNRMSPQKCDASDDRPISDTEDLDQSDYSVFSDIDVILPTDPENVSTNEDTDLLLGNIDLPSDKYIENECILSTSDIGHTIDECMTTVAESNNQSTVSCHNKDSTLNQNPGDNLKAVQDNIQISSQNVKDPLLSEEIKNIDEFQPLTSKEIRNDAILYTCKETIDNCLDQENISSSSKDLIHQDDKISSTSMDSGEENSKSQTEIPLENTKVDNDSTTILKDLRKEHPESDHTKKEETMKPDDDILNKPKDLKDAALKLDNANPSTSKNLNMTNDAILSTSKKASQKLDTIQPIEDQIQKLQENKDPIPSTSKTDEDAEDTSDSLGLLAESSRMMEDDEDQEEDEEGDNGDDDEEFDPEYESSNQMTVEQSEDSSTRQSELDGKESKEDDKIAERPFEFSAQKDDQTVEAQDSIDIESKISDTSDDENKCKDLPEEKTEKSPSAVDANVVELDSEDDVQETKDDSDVTSVNLPAGIDVIASHSSIANTDIRVKEGEIVISGIPKPAAVKVARLNTAEVSIKTTKLPPLEVFNLDSDEDMEVDKEVAEDKSEVTDAKLKSMKCVNEACPHLTNVFYVADSSALSFYNAKKCRYVCEICAEAVVRRNERLIEGIRNFENLVLLDLGKDIKDSIEVLDSDSDDDVDPADLAKEVVGEKGAKLLEEQLANIFNEQWDKYKMETRLLESVDSLKTEMEELERQSKEVDEMLKECQKSTDNLRNELYTTFKPDIKQLPPITISDMNQVTCYETHIMETRLSKRRLASSAETPAKRKADCEKTNNDCTGVFGDKGDDDNTDITVVQLSTENAPPDLPPVGELERPHLRPGMPIYAMRNMFGTWGKAHIVEVIGASNSPFSMCRIKFDKSQKNMYKTLSARNLAYCEPANARMTIGTRVIALFQGSAEVGKESKLREKFYSGIVAEVPNPVNSFRYLIFFDDGYAQYATHVDTRLVCEYSTQVWEEVHPFSRLFVKEYLFNYPQRPMVRLKANETIKTEWKDKWWPSKVVKVDASLVLVQFLMGESKARLEWIYRGSTRLEPLYREIQAAGRQRQRAMPRPQAVSRPNMPIVEYMRSDEQKSTELQNIKDINNEELRRQRAVAKKSTATPTPAPVSNPTPTQLDSFYSRVVYYTPKKAVRPYKITANHVCGPNCKRKDVLSLKDLLTYNPLAKPLLSGWERQIVRSKHDKRVMYSAPCGRRIRNMEELLRYLQTIKSDMGVDLFDFGPNTHCLAEYVINKYVVSKKDLANGKENVPVPCVNFYDGSLPEFCAYSTERTPTAGVPLNLDPEFLCGCDCEDDCEDKTKCACWKLTLEGAKTIGIEGEDVGYDYKRLPEPLRTGIYECNSRCKCKSTCLNRVVQHPLQLKLQVFKTPNRGWGIRALNDVPKGCFICIYVGNLLTDATANLDGLNEGDEYLAELDYIEVVEQTKEGYEEDIPEAIKALDKKEGNKTSEESESEEEEEEEEEAKSQSEDEEFKPVGYSPTEAIHFNKRLRKRKMEEENKSIKREVQQDETEKEGNGEDGCITISDDEEVREPSSFTAAAGMGQGDFVSRHRSVRKLFGEDEACYIMDAKVQGNIGRYLNHSCCPNVFVQNVFVDTHDPRFPWVAFFASSHIKAGQELTWNYNYDIGSVPGKVLYCYCGETNCRGRLL
ncbi:histone-lysine N-methyltransferase eggless isoform X2 [Pieris napi]|uniref:histone-lysine N-methyltransferase eggless isoform X2 n=1 Tax=Pieris napi TaxID=78633 RepID=UPI001FBAEDAD|nr:histone-lysine N-methyltransferase eggless isoform X2 [Pieris napi]